MEMKLWHWVFFTFLAVCWQCAATQCSLLTAQDLAGDAASGAGGGLIASAIQVTSNYTSVTNVELLEYNLVCLSTSGIRDKFSYVSVVAEYRIDNQTDSNMSQFEFGCNGVIWGLTNGSSDDIVTTPPDARLNTTLRTDCSRCLNYRRPGSINNNTEHCQDCLNCEGLNLCTTSSCCNVFGMGGQCAEQCPPNTTITNSDFTCSCHEGFTGSDCTKDIDDCEPNPCQNGGVCTDQGTSEFLCNCTDGFGGFRCEDPVCTSPCQNGGMCAVVNGSVTCRCVLGFEGSACQDVVLTEGCGTTCFITIIVVVVGLILFVTFAVIVVTIVTIFQKDKKIRKYNVHKKKKRSKKAPQGKKKRSVHSLPHSQDKQKDLRDEYTLQNLQSQPPQALRVTLEPLSGMDDEEAENEGTENEAMDSKGMENERIEVELEGMHATFENELPARFQTEGISMELPDF